MSITLNQITGIAFPTRKTESWKYTPLNELLSTEFIPGEKTAIPTQVMEKYLIPGLEVNRVVFVNGEYEPTLSEIKDVGIEVRKKQSERKNDDDSFALLNSLFTGMEVRIVLKEGSRFLHPIHILHIGDNGIMPMLSQPHHTLEIGKGARAECIISFHSTTTTHEPRECALPIKVIRSNFTNAVIEMRIGAHAVCDLYIMEDENDTQQTITSTFCTADEGSQCSFYTFSFGGKLIRNSLSFTYEGSQAHGNFFGLYCTNGKNHIDNRTVISHENTQCTTIQNYKGILGGDATGVFNGKIYVAPGAAKSSAVQINKNILLSEKATINTCPAFEIYADEVKCNHAAISGQLDEEALFYMSARGIGRENATRLLTFAFASEIVEKIKLAPLELYMREKTIAYLQTHTDS